MTPQGRQIGSIIAALTIVAGAWLYFGKYYEAPQQQNQDETADWNTYRNKEYGFEFKYPANLNTKEFSGSHALAVNVFDGTALILNLRIDPVGGYEGEDDALTRTFMQDGHEFVIRSSETPTEANKRAFDQILSTFKFTK